jgi:hypothetical protein
MSCLILRQIENTSQKNELFRLIYRSFRLSIIIRFSGTSAGQDFGTCEPIPTSEDSFDPGREGRRQENVATGEGVLCRMTRGRGRGTGVPGRVETKISFFAKIIFANIAGKNIRKGPNYSNKILRKLSRTFKNVDFSLSLLQKRQNLSATRDAKGPFL